MPNVIQSKSQINYSYATIKITQSRIDKGLIAIPATIAKWFPNKNDTIQVHLSDSPVSEARHYSSYSSSTRECRIGGMREWFGQNDIKSGDEIVIQLLDKEKFIYRLIPERNFLLKTKELQHRFDLSENEQEALGEIKTLSQWICLDKNKIMLNEYNRLTNTTQSEDRQYIKKSPSRARESAPANLRILLGDIYKGHCQLCNFWFIKRDKRPYFEIHHLDPFKGHHPKNLVVVCGNCHNQFEHANVNQEFDDNKWLIKVSFNQTVYSVRQVLLTTKLEPIVKELLI